MENTICDPKVLHGSTSGLGLMNSLNGVWHERGLRVFTAIVLMHWAEHLLQAYQVYVLEWPLPRALGLIGSFYPWLVKSEAMHYGYALVMLAGLWVFRSGFVGTARRWWMIAFWIQFWHHIEHGLLQAQAVMGHNLGGGPAPMSVLQFFIRRVELHLAYNTIVFIPMVIAMYYHLLPPLGDSAKQSCTCAVRPGAAPAA